MIKTSKKTILLLALTGICGAGRAQAPQGTSILFTYDAAGNRIKREVIQLNAELKTSGDDTDSAYSQQPGEEFVGADNIDPGSWDTGNGPGEAPVSAALSGLELSIFPNPVSASLTVSTEGPVGDRQVEMAVFDVSGKQLQKPGYTGSRTTVNFAGYSPGSYILRISVNGTQKEWLIVKE